MPDPRFFETLSPLSVAHLAAQIGGEVERGGDRMIASVAPLSSADGGAIAFLGDRKFAAALATTQAGCVIVPAEAKDAAPKTTIEKIAETDNLAETDYQLYEAVNLLKGLTIARGY